MFLKIDNNTTYNMKNFINYKTDYVSNSILFLMMLNINIKIIFMNEQVLEEFINNFINNNISYYNVSNNILRNNLHILSVSVTNNNLRN